MACRPARNGGAKRQSPVCGFQVFITHFGEIMESESQICFGSREIEIGRLVDALALAAGNCGLTLDWQPNAEAAYVNWYGYAASGSWIHCSDSAIARQLAKEIARDLGIELALFKATCEYDAESGELGYEARAVSSTGKIMPMPSTSLDDKYLDGITAGKIDNRLSQILDELTGCHIPPFVSHSFRLFAKSSASPHSTEKAERVIERRVEETLLELENGISATLARYDSDSYEYVIRTRGGYPSAIYVSEAEMRMIQSRLRDDISAKIRLPTIQGPLD